MKDFMKLVKFDENGLVPVVTQEFKTDEVLMLAYMNSEALKKTFETGMVYYWSRSRNKLWLKGETSGHFQEVKSVSVDCDGDSLLVKVKQTGEACHTGHFSCFFRKFELNAINDKDFSKMKKVIKETEAGTSAESDDENLKEVLRDLYEIIQDRKINPKEGSYTNYLFSKGTDKILKKIGEETAEVIIAAKNSANEEIKYEISDLLYHVFVLLVERGIDLDEIFKELKRRK